MKKLFLIAGILLAALAPLACQKTYNLGPLTATAATATPTPACSDLWSQWGVTCASGINWNIAYVANYYNYQVSSYQYGATLALAVNCAPETTAGVTFTGPGVTLPLAYNSVTVIGGVNYALYESNTVNGGLTTTDFYTLTSVTSIGTASASLALPQTLSFDSAGVSFFYNSSMAAGCGLNVYTNYAGINYYGITGPGFNAPSGAPYPPTFATTCSSPCILFKGVQFFNATQSITGGSGLYDLSNGAVFPVTF